MSYVSFLTPLLWNATIYKRKIAPQANLAVLYNFLCNSQMNADLNIIFRMSRKEGREFEGAFIKYFTSKGGH